MRSYTLAFAAAAALLLAPSYAAAAQPTVADLFSSTQGIRVSGDRAYTISTAGLSIYDVSDRANPRRLSQLFLDRSGSFKLEVAGDYAYVLSGAIVFEKSYLRVVDVAGPANMRLVGSLDLEGEGYLLTSKRFYVDGETLYVAAPRGLDIYDASDPAELRRLGTFATPDVAENVVVRDAVAYVNTLRVDDGIQVIDVYAVKVKNPSRPKLKGRRRGVDGANYAHDLALAGNRLYLLDAGPGAPFPFAGDGRLLVFDVRKKAPRLVSKTFTSPSFNGYAQEIALAGDVAYVADGLDGVSVISVAGAMPEFLRAIDTPGFAIGVVLDADGSVLVADQSSFQMYAPE